MLDFKSIISQYIDQFNQFFLNAEDLIFIMINNELKIISHNQNFKNIVKSPQKCEGQYIKQYLLPESQEILPLSDSQSNLSIKINFVSTEAVPLPMSCFIFRNEDNGYIILGNKLSLTNEVFLQKMATLTNEMANMSRDLSRKNRELEEARSKIKILSGIIPICMHCKEIRDDQGYWNKLEEFITDHSEAQFSHSICDKCLKKHYPDIK